MIGVNTKLHSYVENSTRVLLNRNNIFERQLEPIRIVERRKGTADKRR
ncbi:MAG: hypothetical protein U7123_16460 [Potamolinea sp.]